MVNDGGAAAAAAATGQISDRVAGSDRQIPPSTANKDAWSTPPSPVPAEQDVAATERDASQAQYSLLLVWQNLCSALADSTNCLL